jgi:predicted component of type VI protein secretion system
VFHFTPKHGSWLNQAALFFGVWQRRFLARGSFTSIKDFERRLERFLKDYHARHAHPYRWTYTGEPLVRDTPLSPLGVSSVKGEPGLARVQSNVNGSSLCQDLTGNKPLDLAWTYETRY